MVRNLTVEVINFNSLPKKKNALEQSLLDGDVDVVLGCETKLGPNIFDKEILPQNYECCRHDRDRHGGGVIIIYKNDLKVELVYRAKSSEFIACKVECTGKKPLIVCAAYRPPDNNRVYMNHLCTDINAVFDKWTDCAFWCGDFNLPDINWESETIQGNRNPLEINNCLIDLIHRDNLTQIVNFPTRVNNTLDLLLTNRPGLVHRLKDVPGISDHDSIAHAKIDCLAQIKRPVKRKVYQWHKLSTEDLVEIRNYVKSAVQNITDTCSIATPVETIWLKVKNLSADVLEKHIPKKMTSCRYSKPWVTRECRALFRRKKKAYRKAKRTNQTHDWDAFRRLRRETQKHCNSAKATFLAKRISDDATTNKKSLYKFIKNTRTDSNGVATLISDGKTCTTPKEKADALNKQFSSVFSPILDHIPNLDKPNFANIKDIVISTNGVAKLLRNTKPNKASGPDNIPAKFLKETANELAPALSLLFQASLKQSEIPLDWRHARVAPGYKPGKNDRSKPSNYRPISLTSLVCKTMEHIVSTHLMGHLDTHKILSDYNHAFRKGRSCETQLVLTVNDLSKALDGGKQVDCILLDFAKAFDKVSHKSLLAKLDNYGVNGSTLQWIEDFLKDRTQVVVVDGVESGVAEVTSGVPQGTVLGPVLFLVYINDLPEGLSCTPRLFADDCLLYRIIDSEEDADLLQGDLLRLESWERRWTMEFAEEKCQVLTITRKQKRNIITKNYKIHNFILDRVDSAKYLGLHLDSKLTFNQHINSICKKAHNTRQFLQRNLSRCDRKTKAQAYTTFVRPIMEYGATVWDPHHANDSQVKQVESVQNKAARFACNDWQRTTSVSGLKNKLNWESLQERRARSRVVLMHKTYYSLVAIPLHLFPMYTTSNMQTRGAALKISKFAVPSPRTEAHGRTFMIAAPTMWNGLRTDLTRVSDPDAFRRQLSKVCLLA